MTHALERPPAPSYLGDCPNGDCEGDLYLRAGRRTMTCRECGQETDVDAQMQFVTAKLQERLMTLSGITSALTLIGTPVPSTVRRWASGARPRPVEQVDGLYRLKNAMDLAALRRVPA